MKLRLGLDVGNRILGQGRTRRLADTCKLRLRKAARNERGAVAIMFALAIVVLAPLILGLFDVYTATEQRARLQDALDAAALYAARSDFQTDAEIDALGDKALIANLKLLRGATLISSDFHLVENNTKVAASATIQPMALAPAFWAHPAVTVNTDVIRNSKNLEVALVLDVTGSMTNSNKISDLRTAASALVDLVVKDTQTPYYSKVAVVPWSMGVNVGTYANSVRGTPTPARSVTAYASWYTGTQKTVSGATNGNPVVVTANSHGFANGDTVMFTGVGGMTGINSTPYLVAGKTTNTFQLHTPAGGNVNGGSLGSYSSGGKVTKCVRTDCASGLTTSTAHGFNVGDYVYAYGLTGLTNTVDDVGPVTAVAGTTAYIRFPKGPTGTYSGPSGQAFCTTYGCEYLRFTNPSGTAKVYQESSCVSERTGLNQYSDAAPSTTPVGFNYPAWDSPQPVGTGAVAGTTVSGPNPCLTNQIIPLSTDKTALKAAINVLQAAGSTGGQVGVAWGWYMLSPNFGYLWPSASRPSAYTAPDTLKVVVLMTDGALNTAYCNGVIAQDSLTGSGSASDHINCNATNGTTFAQSTTLCANMKAAGVIVYTVGYQVTGDVPAETLMTSCATDAHHQYMPTSGADLSDAFKAIGADINNLRLAH